MKEFMGWYLGSPTAMGITIVLLVVSVWAGLGYGLSSIGCMTYANAKEVEWEVSSVNQCWILVDGKKYTKSEYSNKFVGSVVTISEEK